MSAGEQGSRTPLVRASEEAPEQSVRAGTATSMQVLIGPDDGAPHFAMRRFRMGPNGGMPKHVNDVEHEQYVLAGRARVGVGDRIHEVKAGDVLYIPAGTPHYYEVVEAPFEFLCMVPNLEDRIQILEE